MLSTIAAGVLSAGAPPAFPRDFYSGEQANLIINQGGFDIQDGACCGPDSPQCKVQAQSMGSDVREQGSMNRTRSDSAQGSIVTWYGSVQKQMAVVPGSAVNSTHKWACVQQCPTQDKDFVSSVVLGSPTSKCAKEHAQDMGKATIKQPVSIGGTEKTCEKWSWEETLFCLKPMSTEDFYVDNTVNPPVPFFTSTTIEPFGQKIGAENTSFVGFQGVTDLDDYFDVDPASIAKCPEPSKGCGDAPPAPPQPNYATSAAQRRFFSKSMYDVAEEAARLGATMVEEASKPLPPPPNVSFGTDFTATEHSTMLINQGGQRSGAGTICCTAAMPQCQIQSANRKGTRYLDVTNQRTRFEDKIANQVIIDFYGSIHKSMLINVTNGKETCQEYCPIDPQDTLSGLHPFDPFDKITDVGQTTIMGETVEHYKWAEKILKIITMQTTDFYAKLSPDKKHGIPVFLTSALTPMGQHIGTQNQTWSDWKPGTPDKAKFDIVGIDVCPKSQNCGQSSQQAHRAASGQWHSFYRDEQATAQMTRPHGFGPMA